ncbi:MAG TPA: hypothetical protein VLK84_05300 [Longimicrobium sp.]|nr:hypothetical protein [Longimicrobium sp.]
MRLILLLLLCTAIPADAQASGGRNTIPYRVVRDTTSGAKVPRLTAPRTRVERAVNRQLDSISASLRCLTRMDGFGRKTEHWSDVRTTYAADDVLSVFIHFGGFCGGAHPINGENVSATFDLRTGKPVAFRDLFADYERDASAIVRAMFPAQTAAADQMTEAELQQLENDEERFCVQFYATEDLAREYFAYAFTHAGLVTEPSLGHAIRACQEVAPVPYARLAPFAAPGGILARVAAARASAAAAP